MRKGEIVDFLFADWLIQWLLSCSNNEIHTSTILKFSPLWFTVSYPPIHSLASRLREEEKKKTRGGHFCLVFITIIFPYKAFSSYQPSHAYLGAWIEYDSEGRLESWIYRLKYIQTPWSLILTHYVSLVNGPVKRWYEVNHLQPPVDTKRLLVMMPTILHLVGQIHSLFNFVF